MQKFDKLLIFIFFGNYRLNIMIRIKLSKIDYDFLNIYICLITIIGCLVNRSRGNVLTNSYLIEFHNDIDNLVADRIALRNGFINKGPVRKFFFFFVKAF